MGLQIKKKAHVRYSARKQNAQGNLVTWKRKVRNPQVGNPTVQESASKETESKRIGK